MADEEVVSARVKTLEATLKRIASDGCKYGDYFGCTNTYGACHPCLARMALVSPVQDILDKRRK